MQRTKVPAAAIGMERKHPTMKRTKLPVKAKGDLTKFTIEEITEELTNTEKARLLETQTEIMSRLINQKKDAYYIGKLLHETKTVLTHGKFIPWIKLTFNEELPYPTAYFYMRIYEVFKDNPGTIQYIPSRFLLMVTSQKFPTEIVKLLNEHPDKINKAGLAHINDAFSELKSGRIGGSQFLKIAENQIKLGLDIWKGKSKHRLNANMRRSLNWGIKDILHRIDSLKKTASDMGGVFPPDPNDPEHKKAIEVIKNTIRGLFDLKKELEGRNGFYRNISTEDGDEIVPNL